MLSDGDENEENYVMDPRSMPLFSKTSQLPREGAGPKAQPEQAVSTLVPKTVSPPTQLPKQPSIGSVVLHTGYTRTADEDMSDVLSGDTTTFEAVLRKFGFKKGKYGGKSGTWILPSKHRDDAIKFFQENRIECVTEKWGKSGTAPHPIEKELL